VRLFDYPPVGLLLSVPNVFFFFFFPENGEKTHAHNARAACRQPLAARPRGGARCIVVIRTRSPGRPRNQNTGGRGGRVQRTHPVEPCTPYARYCVLRRRSNKRCNCTGHAFWFSRADPNAAETMITCRAYDNNKYGAGRAQKKGGGPAPRVRGSARRLSGFFLVFVNPVLVAGFVSRRGEHVHGYCIVCVPRDRSAAPSSRTALV